VKSTAFAVGEITPFAGGQKALFSWLKIAVLTKSGLSLNFVT
jgi:hypothetical protein